MIVSCWVLTEEEKKEILEDGRIWLSIMGAVHPPVWIGSTTELERFTT